jgi:hypothetical protein
VGPGVLVAVGTGVIVGRAVGDGFAVGRVVAVRLDWPVAVGFATRPSSLSEPVSARTNATMMATTAAALAAIMTRRCELFT